MSEKRHISTLGLCLMSSHFSLVAYWILSGKGDTSLYTLIFATGMITIFTLTATKNNPQKMFLGTVATGISTFIASVMLCPYFPIYEAVFKWCIQVAFTLGTLRSGLKKLMTVEEFALKNFVYCTMTLALNLIYALIYT